MRIYSAALLIVVISACTKSPSTPVISKPVVANLVALKEKVEVKRTDTLVWERADHGLDLFNRDTLRTGAGAEGEIEFLDHARLHVGENSTIVIHDYSNKNSRIETSIALPQGSVHGQIGEDIPTEVTVRTVGGWLKVGNVNSKGKKEPAKFSARIKNENEAAFQLSSGHGVLLTASAQINLTPGEEITVKGKGLSNFEALPDIDEKDIVRAVTPTNGPTQGTNLPFSLISPKDKSQIAGDNVTITARAGPGFEVFLNGDKIPRNSQGLLTIKTALKPGVNLLVFQIVNTKTNEVTYKNLELVSTN